MDQPLKILVIDDVVADFLLVERYLRQHGPRAECRHVAHGADLAAALDAEWDLVLSDYSMPDLEFGEVLQRIKARWPDLPVILVSGSVGEETAVDLLRMGLTDFVLKQNLIRLPAAIRRALDEAAEYRARRDAERALREGQAAALETQRRGRLAALNLMEDAIAARTSAEAAVKALQESEERLKLALRAAHQGTYDLNIETGEAIVSPEYATMLGYDPASFHENYASWSERLHPDDRGPVAQTYRDCIVAGKLPEFRMEFRQRTRAGDWKWILSLGRVVARDGVGKPLRMVGTHTDITEQKSNELALAFHTRRVETLLALPAAAETMNEGEFLQHGLEQAEQLTGSRIAFIHFVLEDQETIELVSWSRATLDYFCKAVHLRHYPVSAAGVWADGLRRREAVVINDYAAANGKHGLPDGHSEMQRLIVVPVIENGLVRMLAGVGNKPEPYGDLDLDTVRLLANAVWDIVLKRRMDVALRESEALNRSTLDSVSAEIAVLDRKGVITAVNRPWRRFAEQNGIEPGQAVPGIGVGANYLEACEVRTGAACADALDASAGIRAVLEGRLSGFSLEYPCHSPGQQRWFSMSVTPLGTQGRGAVVAHTDITQRKRDEAELRKLALAIEQSPESVVITDTDACIEYVNQAFLRNTGYSREEVIGRNPRMLHSGRTTQETYREMWAELSEGRPWKGEFHNRR
ncbi:MAG: PAS domain S-box protein, partial [Rhodocyclales bacterium]|nr:PAS domain S-box protein [Rhodocyclales bacterium]